MNHVILSKQEEEELLKQYHTNKDVKAKEKLILSNLRLVRSITNRFSNRNELFSEGCCGLIEAIDRYSLKKGGRLATYAIYWIKAYCFEYLINNHRMVKMATSTEKKKVFFGIGKARRQLEQQGITPTTYMLAMELGASESDVEEVSSRMMKDVWIDRSIGDEDDSITLGDVLPSGSDVEDEIFQNEKNEKIKSFMKDFKSSLSRDEEIILNERILKERKLHEVGDYLKCSKERVRQLENHILSRLVDVAVAKGIDKSLSIVVNVS